LEKSNSQVYFSLYGDYFPIDVVSDRLGLKPKFSYCKGEVIPETPPLRHSKTMYRKETIWEIGTDFEETYDINNQIIQVMRMIKGKEATIKQLIEEFNLQCYFMIVMKINEGETPATYINKEFIRLAYELDTEIHFDIYANPYKSYFED
jgi:hypothetical protein